MKTSELREAAALKQWQPAPEDGPALAAEVIRLREALRELGRWTPSEVLPNCDGNKCREQWCAGCYGDQYAEEAIASVRKADAAARALLTEHDE